MGSTESRVEDAGGSEKPLMALRNTDMRFISAWLAGENKVADKVRAASAIFENVLALEKGMV